MNRLLTLAMALSLGSLVAAQDLSKKISVEIPAARASVALAALGKAAGVTMEPGANLRDDVFVIEAHDVTVDEIMHRVAAAEGGTWVQQSGLWLLTRDPSVTIAQQNAELAARAQAIKTAIAKMNEGVTKNPKFDQQSAQQLADQTHKVIDQIGQGGPQGQKGGFDINGAEQKTPTARAIARILSTMNPAKLAQIGPNQRVVFSTDPTAVQQSLSGQGSEAFRKFVDEQALYMQAYNSNQPQDPTNTRVFMINGLGTPTMGPGDPKLGLGLGLVVIQRRTDSSLSVEILAADTKYETVATGRTSLRLPSAPVNDSTATDQEPLKISAEAKEMAKALGSSGGGRSIGMKTISVSSTGDGTFSVQTPNSESGHAKLSPELRAKILDPVTYDPMSFVPGEAMLALAKQENKNLVALLPDTCFWSMSRQFVDNVTASQFTASLGPIHSLNEKEDDAWIVVSPSLPATGRAGTVNRAALKALLRSMDKNGSVRLDEVAEFALAENGKVPGINDFDILYPRMIDSGITDHDLTPLATGSDSLYKFYGSLPSTLREALGAGRQIPFTNLSGQQLNLVADMLYNSDQGPSIQQDDPQPGRPQQIQNRVSVIAASGAQGMPMFFSGPLSAQTERTIIVPNGVNNDGFIQGSVSTQQIVQGINSQTGGTQLLDAGNLAMSRNAANQPELASFSGPQFDKYRMAHQTTLSLKFLFSPKISMSRSLRDSAVDQDAVAAPYDSLPAAFRQQVDRIGQQMQGAFGKLGGQGAPPPR